MTDRKMLQMVRKNLSLATEPYDEDIVLQVIDMIDKHLSEDKSSVVAYGIPAIGISAGMQCPDAEAVQHAAFYAPPGQAPKALVFHNGRFYGVLMT